MPQDVSVVPLSSGTTTPTTPFAIVEAPNSTWSLQVVPSAGGTTPAAGQVILWWYRYRTNVIAQADLLAQQAAYPGPNRGIFSVFISDSSLQTVSAAYQRATSELTEYGYRQEMMTFNTSPEFTGWFRAGNLFTLDTALIPNSLNNGVPGFTAPFLCISLQTTFVEGGYRQSLVTAVRVG